MGRAFISAKNRQSFTYAHRRSNVYPAFSACLLGGTDQQLVDRHMPGPRDDVGDCVGDVLGLALVPATIAAVQGISAAQSGLASGLLNTSRLLGGAFGLAVLSTIADSHTTSQLAHGAAGLGALTSGYQLALGIGALISLLGAFLTVLLLRPSAQLTAAEASSGS
jgi:hypothetical protein